MSAKEDFQKTIKAIPMFSEVNELRVGAFYEKYAEFAAKAIQGQCSVSDFTYHMSEVNAAAADIIDHMNRGAFVNGITSALGEKAQEFFLKEHPELAALSTPKGAQSKAR